MDRLLLTLFGGIGLAIDARPYIDEKFVIRMFLGTGKNLAGSLAIYSMAIQAAVVLSKVIFSQPYFKDKEWAKQGIGFSAVKFFCQLRSFLLINYMVTATSFTYRKFMFLNYSAWPIMDNLGVMRIIELFRSAEPVFYILPALLALRVNLKAKWWKKV